MTPKYQGNVEDKRDATRHCAHSGDVAYKTAKDSAENTSNIKQRREVC